MVVPAWQTESSYVTVAGRRIFRKQKQRCILYHSNVIYDNRANILVNYSKSRTRPNSDIHLPIGDIDAASNLQCSDKKEHVNNFSPTNDLFSKKSISEEKGSLLDYTKLTNDTKNKTDTISTSEHVYDSVGKVNDSITEEAFNENEQINLENRQEKKRNKLTRRKACYRQNAYKGRSKSLSHIDTLTNDSDTHSNSSQHHTGSKTPDLDDIAEDDSTKPAKSGMFTVAINNCDSGVCIQKAESNEGLILKEALEPLCKRHQIDVNSVNACLENTSTCLPLLTTETKWLSNKQVNVIACDDVKKCVSKISQIKTYRKISAVGKISSRRLGLSSDESHSSESQYNERHDKICSKHKTSTRWNGFFTGSQNKSEDSLQVENMIQQLKIFSRYGIPRLPEHLLSFDAIEEEELYNLESNWEAIVKGRTLFRTEIEYSKQNAIWELIQTESVYIHSIKVVIDLFMACLYKLQSSSILTSVRLDKLFSNIIDVYTVNRHFWHTYVSPMLEISRRTQQPLHLATLYDGFMQFDKLFHPYVEYCLDQPSSKLYCKHLTKTNSTFNGYLAWCETQKDCNRLRLVDILAIPWQRITKYSLLLKAIQKTCETKEEKRIITLMIKSVDDFVSKVDHSLFNRHELMQMNDIVQSIGPYECGDIRDEKIEHLMKPHLNLNLFSSMPACSNAFQRHLFYRGDLRIRDAVCSKMDVHCYLFTDMLLVCKQLSKRTDTMKVIRTPFLIERLIINNSLKDLALYCVYLNEFQLASAWFVLFCTNAWEFEKWTEKLQAAQRQYKKYKYSSLNSVTNADDDVIWAASSLRSSACSDDHMQTTSSSSFSSVDTNDERGCETTKLLDCKLLQHSVSNIEPPVCSRIGHQRTDILNQKREFAPIESSHESQTCTQSNTKNICRASKSCPQQQQTRWYRMNGSVEDLKNQFDYNLPQKRRSWNNMITYREKEKSSTAGTDSTNLHTSVSTTPYRIDNAFSIESVYSSSGVSSLQPSVTSDNDEISTNTFVMNFEPDTKLSDEDKHVTTTFISTDTVCIKCNPSDQSICNVAECGADKIENSVKVCMDPATSYDRMMQWKKLQQLLNDSTIDASNV